MVTKHELLVTGGGKTPPSKSCDFFITWSRDKWKKLTSALPQYQYQWPSNLAKW